MSCSVMLRALLAQLILLSLVLTGGCDDDAKTVDILIDSGANGVIEERVGDIWRLVEDGTRAIAPESALRLRATAADGHRFASWAVIGAEYGQESNLESREITLTGFVGGAEVRALFVEEGAVHEPDYTLQVTVLGQGTIEVDGSPVETPFISEFTDGTEVLVRAVPAAGWEFEGFSGDVVEALYEISVTVDRDKSLVATFVEEGAPQQPGYTLAVLTEGQGAIEVDGSPVDAPYTGEFADGAEVQVKAVAATGWEFADWSGDATGDFAEIMVTMDGDKNLVATFVEESVTDGFTVTFAVDDALEGVRIEIFAGGDPFSAHPVAPRLTTESDGLAAVELESGEYWFSASLDGRYDHEDSFEVTDSDELVEFGLAPVPHDDETGYAGGTGSSEDPFLVGTAAQLDNVRLNLDAHFRQVATLDLAAYGEGDGWETIGPQGDEFFGTYDGAHMKIHNLVIRRGASKFIGLFGYTESGSLIANVVLSDVEVEGDEFVGGLVGYCEGNVVRSVVSGEVVGNREVGGLVGYHMGSIDMSASYADVLGNSILGGLVGRTHMNRGKIDDSYARGSVRGRDGGGNTVGGLVGVCNGYTTNSYSTGRVEGEDFVGGLVGYGDHGARTGCYWDKDSSGQETSEYGGDGRTRAQMRAGTPDAVLDAEGASDEGGDIMYEGWDDQVWFFGSDDDYPVLK